jgi:protein-disulfide isomerase
MGRVVSRVLAIVCRTAVAASVAVVAYVAVTSRLRADTAVPTLSELAFSGGSSTFLPSEDITDHNLRVEFEQLSQGAAPRWAIVEFADFQCPFCGGYARDTFPAVKREYIDTGKIEYAFRHFPLKRSHPHAVAAADAAECARTEGKFWSMHERLFSHQQALDRVALQGHAAAIGLSPKEFDVCTSDGPKQRVRDDHAMGVRLGVKGTPTFFIGLLEGRSVRIMRVIRGSAPFGAFQWTLQALEESRR